MCPSYDILDFPLFSTTYDASYYRLTVFWYSHNSYFVNGDCDVNSLCTIISEHIGIDRQSVVPSRARAMHVATSASHRSSRSSRVCNGPKSAHRRVTFTKSFCSWCWATTTASPPARADPNLSICRKPRCSCSRRRHGVGANLRGARRGSRRQPRDFRPGSPAR
ncbi:MAG: hypothetical protein CFH42_00783 [Alphaproteobacteria bacterium MarineAlpha12_Bin1]|nr:MAG: hypothetical protein CFH42_00783 [Alphaproteobacteria bacterium MarineAlpha12_Bin1]